jgi:hypothetical protein
MYIWQTCWFTPYITRWIEITTEYKEMLMQVHGKVCILGEKDAHITYHTSAYFGMIHDEESVPYLRVSLHPYLNCMAILSLDEYQKNGNVVIEETLQRQDTQDDAVKGMQEALQRQKQSQHTQDAAAKGMQEALQRTREAWDTQDSTANGMEEALQRMREAWDTQDTAVNGTGEKLQNGRPVRSHTKKSHKKQVGSYGTNGRKALHNFSIDIVQVLMQYYRQNPRPVMARRLEISEAMGLKYQQITSWFYNHRIRLGKKN